MRVLIACEFSGTVRDAFRARGHDAWSCDLLPDANSSPYHFRGDILGHIRGELPGWNLLIAHPPCTFLTNASVWALKDPDFDRYPGVGYHQKLKPGTLFGAARRDARAQAIAFFNRLWTCQIERIAIENPIGGLSAICKPSQTIHPHQFGHDASKGTCLWLRGLPNLIPTGHIAPRMVDGKPRWANQTDSGQNRLAPSDDRWAVRSVTYLGIANAMAEQWSNL